MSINKPIQADAFSSPQIEEFKKVLLDEGEVRSETFDNLIARNPKIMFMTSLENPDGIGALKIPFEDYRREVFAKAGCHKNPENYRYELGWIVSRKKGCGNQIMECLLADADCSLYATVRRENEIMIYLLKKHNFIQEGVPYKSSRGDYELLLFTR